MKTIKNLTADEIRKSILQLAIQGKLVKQNPDDEPASELVKKIYAEKKRLIAEGKIKKDKNESFIFKGDDNCYYEKIGKNEPIKIENLPFDIPNNWTWIRQSSLCWLENGEKTYDKKLPYLEAKVIRGLKEPDYVNSGIIVDQTNKVILVDGENSGEIMTPPFKGYLGSTFKIFAANASFNYDYLLLIFLLNKEMYRNSKVGAAIPHLNKELFRNSLIAVPPLEEQQRIVDEINSFEPLLQEYDTYEKKLSKLEEEFPEKLKKSILQYAIEGKLVKQDPNDEPASVLLERIKAEKESLIKAGKIKRDKNESYIYQGDDKNYYENLPNNWIVMRLKEVLLPMTSKKPKGDFFRYIDIDAVDNKKNIIREPKIIKASNASSRASREVNAGDVLFSIVRPYLKNIAVVTNEYSDCIATTGFYVCRPASIIKTEFLFYYLLSPKCIDSVMPYMKGDNSPSIRGEDLVNLFIALPSINTQTRVCKKIRDLLNQIIF